MSDAPKISVIVPVYKVEKQVRRCIESIICQTFKDFELILVDDGSPDMCPQICDEYAEKYDNIKVIHQENRGQSNARNIGVAKAKGEYIVFVDSDDFLASKALEFLYAPIAGGHVNFSMGNFVRFSDKDESAIYEPSECKYKYYDFGEDFLMDLYDDFKLNYNSRCFTPWAKCISKDLVLKFPFEEGRIYEDGPVIHRVFANSKKIAVFDEPIYYYYTNPTGTTKSKDYSEKRLDDLWAWGERMSFYKEYKFKKCYALMYPDYIDRYIQHLYKIKTVLKNNKLYNKTRIKLIGILLTNFQKLELTREKKFWYFYVLFPYAYKMADKISNLKK